MVGFRAAGWTLFAAAVVSVAIGLVGLRRVSIVGRGKMVAVAVELTVAGRDKGVESGKDGGAVMTTA
jgi:hypothetical protein